MISDSDKLMQRWAEYFHSLLKARAKGDATCLLKQRELLDDMALPISHDEVKLSLSRIKNGRAAGPDGIPAELLKAAGPAVTNALHRLFNQAWEKETLPQDFRDADIVPIFKRKGKRTDCTNYRGIALLSIAGKILADIIVRRLTKSMIDNILPESQCGFRANRGTADMVFTLRQIQEKCREQQRPLYICFVDLTKAFDSVSRQTLWDVLRIFGCPEKLVHMIRLFHDDMLARIKINGQLSDPFPVINGVKQGCKMAPIMFAIFLAAALSSSQTEDGVLIKFRYYG